MPRRRRPLSKGWWNRLFRPWAARRASDLEKTAGYWSRIHATEKGEFGYWLALPEVMRRVNVRVGGREHVWPLSWFLLDIEDRLPVRRALSVGCGTGSLEREVVRHGGAERIDAVDVSPGSIETAARAAREKGLDQIRYHCGDALSWLREKAKEETYDLVFFHASLHHIADLEEILGLVGESLGGGLPGLLYVDEYVGPSRHQWDATHLGFANGLYRRIPEAFRRTAEVLPPVAFDDPTEMVRSSEIPRLLRERFEVVEYRPYYGNVVMPLVNAIRVEGLEDRRVLEILRKAMDLEDHLIERDLIEPFYAVFVCRPRP